MKTKDSPVYTFFSVPIGGKWSFVGKAKRPHTFISPKNLRRDLKPKQPCNSNSFEIFSNPEKKALFRFKKI